MAIDASKWARARALFELGKSLTEIAEDTGINRTTVSKKAKSENWEKEKIQQLESDIIEYEREKSRLEGKKSTLFQRVAKLDDFAITVLDESIMEKTHLQSLITSTSQLALIRTNEVLTKNSTVEKVNIGEGIQGFGSRELNPRDIRECVEIVDKASITLGINDRHATSKVEVNQNQATQLNNNIGVNWN